MRIQINSKIIINSLTKTERQNIKMLENFHTDLCQIMNDVALQD